MSSKFNFKKCGWQHFLLGEKIGGTCLCTTWGHIIDHHDSTSCVTPLVNPNYIQSHIVNPTNPHIHPTSPLDCIAAPNLFCTPVDTGHIPIIHWINHQEVRIVTSTNQNNNDLDREFICSIKKGPPPRRCFKITFYLHKNANHNKEQQKIF